jgi:microcystin degradation protein MlrC
MYGGGIASLGPSALLHVVGTQVRVVVSSVRVQGLDRALFTHFGIEPLDVPLVGVKSTAHFRADFEPGARGVICVEASGVFPCRLDASRYRCLRPGMRMGPLGPIFGQNV